MGRLSYPKERVQSQREHIYRESFPIALGETFTDPCPGRARPSNNAIQEIMCMERGFWPNHDQ